MLGLEPEKLFPGNGPPVAGAARAPAMLDDGAQALESLVAQTLALMNEGRSLDQVLHAVRPPAALLAKPYLLPKYDDPEFVVRGIWHLYAGWFGGNPAQLKPAPDAVLAREIARLAGGAHALAERAAALAASGELRLAAHLIEFASGAAPEDAGVQKARAALYGRCAEGEPSLIGKAIYAAAAREARERAEP
jgi:alkyl sulfatase BDS1-like metallo-beta-lactamase superfamily hydrolase